MCQSYPYNVPRHSCHEILGKQDDVAVETEEEAAQSIISCRYCLPHVQCEGQNFNLIAHVHIICVKAYA